MLLAAGAATGLLAGMFGVGGGAISVPILFFTFGQLGVVPEVAMPLAVGTSLAIIVPTSLRSAFGHYQKGALDSSVLKLWLLPILIGVLSGATLARFAQPWVFQLAFIVVSQIIAFKLFFGKSSWRLAEQLPHKILMHFYGLLVGLSSSLMGIGGGALSTLILTLYGRPIHQAIATSAGVGLLISLPGAVGYIFAGWGKAGLPFGSIGFVSFLAVAFVVPATLLTAGLGVRIAHQLSRRALEKYFGFFLVLVSLRFIAMLLA
jgi:uncharacterized membrane protein YfcA